MGRRPPPPVYKRPKDLGQSRTYWWHDGWIAPELRLYAPEQERTAGDDDDEPPSPSRPSPREEHSPRGERAAEGAAANASAEGGAGGSDAPEPGADRPARSPKKRLTWTQDLKALFRESLAATAAHGLNQSPAKILEFMHQRDAGSRTSGLTRTHVASFLQKYRKAQERLEAPRPRVVYDDRYVVYAGGRAMGTADPMMGFAQQQHHRQQPRVNMVAPHQPHYQHPALANAMGVPYIHHVTAGGASVPVMGMGTMGAMGMGTMGASTMGASTRPATYGAIGNNLIGTNPPSVGTAVAKGTNGQRSIAPRPTAAHHSPLQPLQPLQERLVHHPYDARVPMVAARSPLQPLVQPLHPSGVPGFEQMRAAEAEARMLETIRLRAAELRRDRKRAAKEAAELAAKETAAGMERERARTITPEVRAEPPPARGGQMGVGGGSGSEGDTAGDVTGAENASTSTRGTSTAEA